MKLAILGGGGMRMPTFLRSILVQDPELFDTISLHEPDQLRRETIGALCAGIASRCGRAGDVTVTADAHEALDGVDFVFSAIRVGGDRARVVDEQVALARGVVGQETVGAGGAAMALRTVPVILDYCRILREVAPNAMVINFTNPAGIMTEAIARHGGVRVAGICDTPSEMVVGLAHWLGVGPERLSVAYGGLNHLGWVTDVRVDGHDRLPEVLARYDELRELGGHFAAFEAETVQRLGAIPSEYVAYFYYPSRYLERVAAVGSSRGQEVARLNEALLARVATQLRDGDFERAWGEYDSGMQQRRSSYMSIETGHGAGIDSARPEPEAWDAGSFHIDGYEAIAMQVITGLNGRGESVVAVNTTNEGVLPFLGDRDVVETPCRISPAGVERLAGAHLPQAAVGLVLQVKAYESALVDAAAEGSRSAAEWALGLHPLVPGVTAARALLDEYRREHGDTLAYLN